MSGAADLDVLLRAAVPDPDGPGCAVGLVRGDEPPRIAHAGLANVEHRVPIGARTVFHVASVSKQFTGYLVGRLARAGRLNLDGVLVEHLDWFPFEEVTLRHLLGHTSGLRDQWSLVEVAGRRMSDVITTDDVVRMVTRQRRLHSAPGSRYEYSNTGYTLLGLVVEAVTGEGLPEHCRRVVFEPLGMRDSLLLADHRRVVRDRADSYAPGADGDVRRVALSYSTVGATSLNTTIADLAAWARHLFTSEAAGLLGQVTRFDARELPRYGLGVHVGMLGGRLALSHAGADAGYRSQLVVVPEAQTAAVVLANHGGVDAQGLALAALSGLLGTELPCSLPELGDRWEAPGPVLADRVARPLDYVGTYLSPELEVVVRLVARDGELVLERSTRPPAPLRLVGPDRFALHVADNLEGRDVSITFAPGRQRFDYSTSGAERVEFHRI